VAAYQQEEGAEQVRLEGFDSLKVVGRLGTVYLPRQVCYHRGSEAHTMPGNRVLPEHQGPVTTRGLKEWACLRPQDVPFGTAQRLLGWQTKEEGVWSEAQLRRSVQEEGAQIRAAEEAEVQELLGRESLEGLAPRLVEGAEPRRGAAWPEEWRGAVEGALAEGVGPPEGVRWEDWERVKEAQREEQDRAVEELARLGPEVREGGSHGLCG
jgi:hypothetical protein